jgi:hypothetical protein
LPNGSRPHRQGCGEAVGYCNVDEVASSRPCDELSIGEQSAEQRASGEGFITNLRLGLRRA